MRQIHHSAKLPLTEGYILPWKLVCPGTNEGNEKGPTQRPCQGALWS